MNTKVVIGEVTRLAVMMAVIVLPHVAWASGGPDLPWNSPMQTTLQNFQGPTAGTVITLGVVVGVLFLIFSGLSIIARTIFTVVIAGAAATQAPALLATLGVTAALM